MRWAVTLLVQCGTIAQICLFCLVVSVFLTFILSASSDVSRTSNISVSSYLRTTVAGQDDMGNDLLMARVDLTPMLDGHASALTLHILHRF